MTRQLSLLLLVLSLAASLTGCGRGTTDLYRAYNIVSRVDKNGKPIQDLASQNRISLQTSGEYSYFYVAPEQKDFANPGTEVVATSSTSDDSEDLSTDESSDEAVDESDEAATDESGDEESSELEDKIDALSDAVDALDEE